MKHTILPLGCRIISKCLGKLLGWNLNLRIRKSLLAPFSADIFAKDVATDKYVVIENQLEKQTMIIYENILLITQY